MGRARSRGVEARSAEVSRLAATRVLLSLVTLLTTLLAASSADAAVRRFAVLIGNNDGASVELPLRYAESDAQRMAAVGYARGSGRALGQRGRLPSRLGRVNIRWRSWRVTPGTSAASASARTWLWVAP